MKKNLGGGRGLYQYAKFPDGHGMEVRVQTSSSVDLHCWVFMSDQENGKTIAAAHLNPERARELSDALLEWLKDYT